MTYQIRGMLLAGVMTLLLAGCSSAQPTAASPQEIPQEVGQLTGVVERMDKDTLSLVDEGGRRWTFSLPKGEEVPAFIPGAVAEVQYEGRSDQRGTAQALQVEVGENFLPEQMGPGILSPSYARGWETLQTLSQEERVEQLFLVRCSAEERENLLTEGCPAGFVLLEEDFAGRSRKEVVAALQQTQGQSALPLLMAVEEIGGTYTPVSSNRKLASAPFRQPGELYRSGGLLAAADQARQQADLLHGLGIQVILAPAADVTADEDSWVWKQAVGQSAEETADYVAAVVKEYGQQKLGCVLSHFPGQGENEDPHASLVQDSRSYETFVHRDLLPFQAGIQAGAPCILVGHTVVNCMDGERPASLSPAVHQLLRQNLVFTGVVLADDLSVPSVQGQGGEQGPVVAALQAGNDLLLVENFSDSCDSIWQAVEDGVISQERLDAACLRVLCWKVQLGLLD